MLKNLVKSPFKLGKTLHHETLMGICMQNKNSKKIRDKEPCSCQYNSKTVSLKSVQCQFKIDIMYMKTSWSIKNSLTICAGPSTCNWRKKKALFFPMPSISGRALLHFKVPRPCPPVLQIRATWRWRGVWNAGRIILTEENLITQRKSCPNAMLSTTNLMWTGLG